MTSPSQSMSAGAAAPAAAARKAKGGRRLPRPSKKNAMLLALVPVLVVVWIPVLRGKQRPAPPPRPAPAIETDEPPAAPGVETAPTMPAASAVTGASDLTHRLQDLMVPFTARWSAADGDPFVPVDATPKPPDATQVPPGTPATQSDLTLVPSAVLISRGDAPLAIIGGRSYRTGDHVDGRRIVGIEERRVLFEHGGKTFAVSLPQPTLGQEQPHD
jgi:hypothetical protein